MSKIALVCYVTAGHQVGSGHLVRSRTLIESLLLPYRLYVFGKELIIKEAFPKATYYDTSCGFSNEVSKLLIEYTTVILLIDSPTVPKEFWDIEHDRLLKITMDDYGGGHIRADIIVNGNADSSFGYTNLHSWTLMLSGLKYLPIRPEFTNVGKDRAINPKGRKVGFIIGSGEEAKNWAEVLFKLDIYENEWVDVKMVTASTMPNFKKIKQIGQANGISVITGLGVNEMVNFYFDSDVCVMTAGMCLYEALAAGTSTIAYPILSGMEKEVAYFEKRNVIVNLGKNGCNPKVITNAVNSLLDSPVERNEMYRKGRSLIDGKGVNRIAKVLMQFFSKIDRGLDKKEALKSIGKEILDQ